MFGHVSGSRLAFFSARGALSFSFNVEQPRWILVAVVLVILCTNAVTIITVSIEGGVYGLLGLLCFIAAAVPLLIKKTFFIFEPPVFVLIAVTIGATLRSIYLVSAPDDVVWRLVDGVPISELMHGGVLAVVGLLFLSIGYMLNPGRVAFERVYMFRSPKWCIRKLIAATALGVIFSALAMEYFFAATGVTFEDLSRLSQKRFVVLGEEGASLVVSHLGYVRLLMGVAELLCYVVLAVLVFKRNGGLFLRLLMLCAFLVLFLAFALPQFVASSRTSFIVFGVVALMIVSLRDGRVPGVVLVPVVVLLIALAIIMVQLRDGEFRSGGDKEQSTVWAVVAETVVGSGNFFPIERTGVIVDRVPEQYGFLYGSSYLSILTAPVPRAVWPEKPPVALGVLVKEQIYDRKVISNGYPSGFVGEAYMNFGILGVPVIAILIGVFFRLVYNSFKPLLATSPAAVVVYATIAWPLFVQMVVLNVVHSLVNTLANLLPLLLVLWFVIGRRAPKSNH